MDEKVLIVEDEHILREVLKDFFISEKFIVLEAENGEEAIELLETEHVDLVILDIMLPKIDGWSVCRRIRKQSTVPVIMLTARCEEEDTLLGFELGADDYVTKPYRPQILLARAKRLLQKGKEKQKVLESEGIVIDYVKRTVIVDDVNIEATFTEFELLAILLENQGIVLTREQLMIRVWGYAYIGDDRTMNTHIRNIRRKLGGKSQMLQTVIRIGYKFEAKK